MKRTLTTLLLAITLVARVQTGWAALAPAPQDTRAEDMQTVQKALENKLVADRLAKLGYTKSEIDVRLAKLSDKELHQLAQKVESMQPAGHDTQVVHTHDTHSHDHDDDDDDINLGAILTVLLVVALIVILL